MSDDPFDPIDERATRAGAGLRSTRVAPGDPHIAHRRVMRRRIAAASTSALVAAAAIVAIVVSTRENPVRVYTPATVSTSFGMTTTSNVATSTSAAPTVSFPALIIADNGGLRVTPTEATTLGLPSGARVAFRLSTCAAFAYEYGSSVDPLVGISGGDCPATTDGAAVQLAIVQSHSPDHVRLDGVGIDGGHDMLLLGHHELRYPPSIMFDVQTGTSRAVDHDARSVAGGILVRGATGASYGLEYHALSSVSCDPDAEQGTPACSAGNLLAAPPIGGALGQHYYILPVLDPTGSWVAFIDKADPPAVDLPALVLSDVKSGRETLRLSLPWPGAATFLDFDGRWAVISRDGLPPLVIDTKAATPAFYQVSNATGMVTFDR